MVTTPQQLSARQRELFEELARTFGSEIATRPSEKKGLLDRMRDLLDG
jgi:DnaJ-class molecular chaperone